jgi:hypothetical protein
LGNVSGFFRDLPADKNGLSKLDTLPDKEEVPVLLPVDDEGQTRPEDGECVQETRVRRHN